MGGNENNFPKDEGEPTPATPFLVIRSTPTDGGARPLAAGSVFWASPAISFAPHDGSGNAMAGTNTTITASVSNLGLAPAFAVNVEFYWADPSLGLSPATGHLIASKLVTVPALSTVQVNAPLPWQPLLVNGGHECLVVQCSSPSEGSGGLSSPFMPMVDRHVGQRNVTVVAANTEMKMMISAPNPFSSAQAFLIELRSFEGRVRSDLADPLLRSSLIAGLSREGDPKALPGIELHIKEVDPQGSGIEVVSRTPTDPGEMFGDLLDIERAAKAFGEPGSKPSGLIIGDPTIKPGAGLEFVFFASPMTGEGAFRVHQVRSWTNGLPVGGYSIVVLAG